MDEQQSEPQIQIDATNPSRLLAYGAHNFKEFAEQMGYSRSHLTRKLSDQWRKLRPTLWPQPSDQDTAPLPVLS